MKRATQAPEPTPKPAQGDGNKTAANRKAVFFSAVLDMTWQLAIVVVVPIVGGFKLDGALHTTPAFTIIGFLVAMGGTFAIMKRMVDRADGMIDRKGDNQ